MVIDPSGVTLLRGWRTCTRMLNKVLLEAESSEEVKLSMSSVGGSLVVVGVVLVAVVLVFLLFLFLFLVLERDFLGGTVVKGVLVSSRTVVVVLVGVTGTGLAGAVLVNSAARASAGVGFWAFLLLLLGIVMGRAGALLLRLERRVLAVMLKFACAVRNLGKKGEGSREVGVRVLRVKAVNGLLDGLLACLWARCFCG